MRDKEMRLEEDGVRHIVLVVFVVLHIWIGFWAARIVLEKRKKLAEFEEICIPV